MMIFPRPVSPLAAWRDLRQFLAQRRPHELLCGFLAVLCPAAIVTAFYIDSSEPVYRPPTIIYFKQWPANRTLAEVHAQQRIDLAEKQKADAEAAVEKAKNRAEFKRLDDRLKRLGI